MQPLPFIDVVGFWIGIFLTFAVLSYLYKDNPFYKAAEHIFVGSSIGYVITQQYYNVLKPNLLDHLERDHWYEYLIPSVYHLGLLLVLMLLSKAASRRLAWIGRYPVAFVVALYAGLQINALAESDLAAQITASSQSLIEYKRDLNTASVEEMSTLPGFSPALAKKVEAARAAGTHFNSIDELKAVPGLSDLQKEDIDHERGHINGLDAQASTAPGEVYAFGMVSRILLLIGLLASLVYFYFSIEQKGAVGKVSRFGIWVLMIGFGASFGMTVQGRLALAVGRAMDVLDKDKPPEIAAQIHGPVVSVISILLIIGGIIFWEKWWVPRQKPPSDTPPDDAQPEPDEDLPAF